VRQPNDFSKDITMKVLTVTDEQFEMIRAAVSYLYSNLDDVNEGLDKDLQENDIDELMLKIERAKTT
jgi:hypothetical protein